MTDIATYSQIDMDTSMSAPLQKSQKLALVVEGGGMRSMFSAGVLDSFHRLRFDPFHLYYGVSAGSLNLISHIAGQYLRNYHVVMFCATSGQFINGWKYLRGGHYVDLDWLSNECLDYHPLDKQGALQHLENGAKKFVIVCTNVETGLPTYYHPNEQNLFNILLGSCCLPLLYRNHVYVSGVRVIDGGISDPIPVQKAYSEGATDIVVIRSRDKDYREISNNIEVQIGSYLFKSYPKFQQTILNQPNIYNNSIAFIERPPADVNIYQIAPNSRLSASLTTTNTQRLEIDYRLGRKLGEEFVHDWQN
ncbi:patatin family protein [Colwelliaceae bacterium 6471]